MHAVLTWKASNISFIYRELKALTFQGSRLLSRLNFTLESYELPS